MKLNLIYDSKCKISTKWWKIKMKTRNLIQISLRNDPINRRMHGFSFWVFEEKSCSSRCDFFFLSRSNFDFKHSMDAEMHQEHKETNGTWNDGLNKSNFSNFQGRHFPSRRTVFKERFLGVTVGWRDASRSTTQMMRRLIETTRLSCSHLIGNGGFRCIHVDCVR